MLLFKVSPVNAGCMADFLIVALFVSMLLCPCVVALRSARAESSEEDGLSADDVVKAAPAMRN